VSETMRSLDETWTSAPAEGEGESTFDRTRWQAWRGYLLAVVVVVVTSALRLLLLDLEVLIGYTFLLYALPVLACAWVGGLGPGFAATLLSALAADFLFHEPRFSLEIGRRDVGPFLIFLLEGLLISALGDHLRRTLDRLHASHAGLEGRVAARTAALQAANRRLAEEAVERERVTQGLTELTRRLEISNRELQDFASVASHDLQEPLRKIQAFGDRLAVRCADQLGPEGNDYLRRMQNAAGRMQTLINDLLAFSRVTTKAQPFVPVDLARVAREVVSDLEARIEQSGATVEVGDLPVLDADPLQMRQLLQNLLGNALKFARPDIAPRVRLGTEEGAEPGTVRLAVADNGIGFDEKYLDRIFTVFQRLHGRGAYEGTGIGLAVCRKIAERHGGAITARSRPGEGATFLVTLPLHQPSTRGETA
jgi:signal transduction histidine kinase